MEEELSKRLLHGEIIVIPRASKSSEYSKRTLQEQKALKVRIEKLGNKYQQITQQINAICHEGVKYKTLRLIAEEASKRTGIKIDRLANRSKQAMNCWFAENWEHIACVIPMAIQSVNSVQIQKRTEHREAKITIPEEPIIKPATKQFLSPYPNLLTISKPDEPPPFTFEVPCKARRDGTYSGPSILPFLGPDRMLLGRELSG